MATGHIVIYTAYSIVIAFFKITNLKSSAILGMFPLTNHDYSEGEQWGCYNLPR